MISRVRPEDRIEVSLAADGSRALRARVRLEAGEVIVPFRVAELLALPARHSIQLGTALHALVEPEALRLTNHSCNPNAVVDTRALCFRAVRPIEPGAEITYFYPSTEWSMAEPFACGCGAARCLLTIAGATYLSAEVLAGYELTDHIRMLLQARDPSPGREPAPAPKPPGERLSRADQREE